MSKRVRVIILRTGGTNCDEETAFAFSYFGAESEMVHINRLFDGTIKLKDYHILAIPGGFTYGDDIIAGRILANELRLRLGDNIREFIARGKLIIGICNGFQVLVRAGLLPGSLEKGTSRDKGFRQTASLTYNDSGKFEDRWVHLKLGGCSVWTEGLTKVILAPVAHAEGKFIPQNDALLRNIEEGGQIVFRYCDAEGRPVGYPYNPNGSVDHVAGICDRSGRVLGMMPHPERHFLNVQHPSWTRMKKKGRLGDGAKIFENGVEYVRRELL